MTLPTLALTLCILGQTAEVPADQPSRGSGIAMTAAGERRHHAGAVLLPMGIKRIINSGSTARRDVELLPTFA
jgi:hypothetical protein